ncbi:MAG TPA: DUF6484 domain-containing protein [Vicinamibacterales bacterium]
MSERAATPTLEPTAEREGHLHDLLAGPVTVRTPRSRIDGALVGRLVAFKDEGTVPLVMYEGQPGSAALPARATLDLHGSHIGRDVVLMFDDGDPRCPIIMGCLHDAHARTLPAQPGAVDVDVDGRRLVVTAKEQLVLRCGKASITLTRSGKVLFQGTYVSNRSSGVLRLKGGSVQIN